MILLTTPILRAVIRFGSESESDVASNLSQLRQEVEPSGIDKHILHFIGDLFDRTGVIASADLVLKHYKSLEEAGNGHGVAGIARVNQCLTTVGGVEQPVDLIRGNDFRWHLDRFKEDLLKSVTSTMLLETSTILATGIKDRKGQLIIGAEAALEHLQNTIRDLHSSLKRGAVEGSFRRDAHLVRKQYEYLKAHPEETVGVLTGIDHIDSVHRGVRNGHLCLVAGFTSHLKTTFCLNWLYKSAVLFGRNSAIASLEMPVEDLRTSLYVLHSGARVFADQGFGPLDYSRVTNGALSPEEEKFFEIVISDFEDNPEYGEILYKEPEASITIHEIQRWAENKHRTVPLDLLMIDYVGLVDPGKGVSSLDSTASLNKVLRQSKMMALTFANGRGIPVVSPFQTNREGLKDAEKNGGRYKITALAGSNEAERSSDLIYFTYTDDVLSNSRELLVGNLKARKCPIIREPFKVFANPETMAIENLESAPGAEDLVSI